MKAAHVEKKIELTRYPSSLEVREISSHELYVYTSRGSPPAGGPYGALHWINSCSMPTELGEIDGGATSTTPNIKHSTRPECIGTFKKVAQTLQGLPSPAVPRRIAKEVGKSEP
jgi:hypothetical protein